MEHSRPLEGATLGAGAVSAAAIEAWLVAHIATSCGVAGEEIDASQPLTSFGLESLTLYTLAGDLATWLNQEIDASLLWEYPTIEEVARHLGQDDPTPLEEVEVKGPSALVTIQPHGDMPPLFLIHDVSGALWCYTALMRHMGGEQPVYGFQVPVRENEALPVSRLEELAARYVEELRREHPQGPYRLAGYSMGGVIAFEMARQLRVAKQEVALLALMDTNYPSLKHARPIWGHRVRINVRNFWKLNPREKVLYVLERKTPALVRSYTFHARHMQPLNCDEKWRYLRDLFSRQGRSEARTHSSEQQRFREVLLHSDVRTRLQEMGVAYKPLPYDGHITLLRARWQMTLDDDSREWRRVALKGTTQKRSAGSHGIIMTEPYVRELAANLRECLRDANV